MSVLVIVALGLLCVLVLPALVCVLIRKGRARRVIWEDEGDLLRLRLWEALR